MIMMMVVVVMKIEYFLPVNSKNHIPPFPNQPG